MVKSYVVMAFGSSMIAQVVRGVAHLTSWGATELGFGLYLMGLGLVWTTGER